MDKPHPAVLHQHLISLVYSAAMQHTRFVLGSDGNLTGQHIHHALVKHLEQVWHAAGHLKTHGYAVGTREIADAVVVISHGVALEDEKACRTVECPDVERVRQLMLRHGLALLATARHHERQQQHQQQRGK